MLQENKRVRKKIPAAFEELMGPHINRVEDTIEPGLTKLSWTSLNIEEYIQNVYKRLEELELLMIRANELTEFRIDAVLQEMATTTLCKLPQDEPWPVEEFLENTQELCAKGATILQTKSQVVQDAATELIDMLLHLEDQEEEMDDDDKKDGRNFFI